MLQRHQLLYNPVKQYLLEFMNYLTLTVSCQFYRCLGGPQDKVAKSIAFPLSVVVVVTTVTFYLFLTLWTDGRAPGGGILAFLDAQFLLSTEALLLGKANIEASENAFQFSHK